MSENTNAKIKNTKKSVKDDKYDKIFSPNKSKKEIEAIRKAEDDINQVSNKPEIQEDA